MSTNPPFYKRIEVWLLILLSGSIALWVMKNRPAMEGDPEAIVVSDAEPAADALVIHRCTLERDYGNARLDIELRYRNISPRPLVLQPPDVRLLTTQGKEVPPYILPAEPPPQVPARTAQSVRLRFWLEEAHLQSGLNLEIRGHRAEVKAEPPLPLKDLPNQQSKSWQGSIR